MKEIKKSIRFSEEEWNTIEIAAAKQDLTTSEYIRERVCYKDSNWIHKSLVVKVLGPISFYISQYKSKGKRLAKLIEIEMEKLWEQL